MTPPTLSNQGVCLTWAHLQSVLWDRIYKPPTNPCSWFSVCIQGMSNILAHCSSVLQRRSPQRSHGAEKRMCAQIHAQALFLESELQDEPDKDKIYAVKRCNSACRDKGAMKVVSLYARGPDFEVVLMCNGAASIRKQNRCSCCNGSGPLPRTMAAPHLQA